MTRLFISHKVSDGADVAHRLVAELELHGYDCWIAPRDVVTGLTYPAQITSAIRAADGVILVLTAGANQSRDVLQEVQLAHAEHKRIIPVIVGDEVPGDDLAYFLNVIHRVPWTSAGIVYEALARALPPPTLPVLTAERAIQLAASSPEGYAGRFKITVRSTDHDDGVVWLNSEEDYRDPRCLSVAVDPAVAERLGERLSANPLSFLRNRTIVVSGTARKVRIEFLSAGRPTGLYYYQTHVELLGEDDLVVAADED